MSSRPLDAATTTAGRAVRRLSRAIAELKQSPSQIHLGEDPDHHDELIEELELYADEATASLDALAQTIRERL